MNCEQFDTIIVNLACNQLADASKRHLALAHAQSCAQCGMRLARQQNVAAGLHTLAVQEQTIGPPPHLAATLQAAFERQQTATTQEIASPISAKLWRLSFINWRWVAATAALLIVSGLVAAALWRTYSYDQSPTIEALTKNLNESPKKLSPNNGDVAGVKYAIKLRPHQRPKTVRREREEYGALISLMPIGQTEAEEFQQVVRMQIPRSTLRLWGLPLNEEGNNEQVSAEVLFSEDGVARAIRLRN